VERRALRITHYDYAAAGFNIKTRRRRICLAFLFATLYALNSGGAKTS
jgi:hypothetical protein